jgi:hypothetical protein
MASYLYRVGDTHTVDGVKCEMILVEFDQLEPHLSAGWSADLPSAELSDDEVREAAKAAGIDGWDVKRLKTLRAELLEA